MVHRAAGGGAELCGKRTVNKGKIVVAKGLERSLSSNFMASGVVGRCPSFGRAGGEQLVLLAFLLSLPPQWEQQCSGPAAQKAG